MPLYRKACLFRPACGLSRKRDAGIPALLGAEGYPPTGRDLAGNGAKPRWTATSVQRAPCLRGRYPLTTTKVDGAEGKPEEGGRSLSSRGFFRPLRDKRYCMCGIFGISGHPEAARMAYFGLYALQHRGQESTGIASYDGKHIRLHAGMGLVPDVYDEATLGQELQGNRATCVTPPRGFRFARTPSRWSSGFAASRSRWPTTAI